MGVSEGVHLNFQVDTVAYRSFSLDTYRLILTGFNNDRAEEKKQWIFISPTLRALLAHGHELVQINNNRGLGDYTEQGLKHNNKFLRFFCQHLARKQDQASNLEDCITRLWLSSDPGLHEAAPKLHCSRCPKGGHHTVSCPSKLSSGGDNTI